MQPLYINADPARSMLTTIVRDADTGQLLITTRQKTAAIVDFNKALASLFDRHAVRGKGRMVANVPTVVWLRWHAQGITRDRKRLLQALSDREARFFRVDDGRPLI